MFNNYFQFFMCFFFRKRINISVMILFLNPMFYCIMKNVYMLFMN